MTPRTFESAVDVQPNDFPVVVKRTFGTFGHGVYIAPSAAELERLLQSGKRKFERDADHLESARFPFVIQQAIQGGVEWAALYARTATGFLSIKCHQYTKPQWKETGLFVKGDGDVRPVATPQPCPLAIRHLLTTTLVALQLEGTGCINFKRSSSDGLFKIFDWNVHRQCGSMGGDVLVAMLTNSTFWV